MTWRVAHGSSSDVDARSIPLPLDFLIHSDVGMRVEAVETILEYITAEPANAKEFVDNFPMDQLRKVCVYVCVYIHIHMYIYI